MLSVKTIFLASFLPCILSTTPRGSNSTHRLFPAGRVEQYGQQSNTLGVVVASSIRLVSFCPDSTNEITNAAIFRFLEGLQRLPNYPADYEINPWNQTLQPFDAVEIRVSSADVNLRHGVNESYTLSIKEDPSSIVIEADTVFGAIHALESLSQLLEFGWLDVEGNPIFIVRNIPIWVYDYPSHPYRGLLIDTSRHFLPLSLILANLDTMLMNKMNILHWHITDSQSFPYLSKTMPELASKGAYHQQMVYTTKDIQRVIHEAYLRGIRVIPEVDMPGHTQAIAASHPNLMSRCPDPSEPLDPTNPQVYDFVKAVYEDLSDLFVDDFVHVGGDEVDLSCWDESKSITDWKKKHNMSSSVDLFELFESKLLQIVEKVGRTPIVWQEVFNLNLTITDSTIIDVWKGFDRKTMEDATRSGYKVILSGCWYLDFLASDWEKFYSCDPSNFTGPKGLLLGGHASMWGEHVDASNFMSRVWPRASAVAERLWTGDVSIAKANVKQRISTFRCRMVQQGFAVQPIGPGFCAHEVPYHECRKGGGKPSNLSRLPVVEMRLVSI